MEILAFGNLALDVICKPVDEVPRHASIGYDEVAVAPGGLASNVAVGLQALGVRGVGLAGYIGEDLPGQILERFWRELGLDLRFLKKDGSLKTAVSIGLVDSQAQPRFLHNPGVNALLTAGDLTTILSQVGALHILHIAGLFVLPGLLDERLPGALARAGEQGICTTLDVVQSPAMDHPDRLWPCLPFLDILFCNAYEAWQMTGESDPPRAAAKLRSRGARGVVLKLGAKGCWMDIGEESTLVSTQAQDVVDTTGSGDAFAAGFLAARLRGEDWQVACQAGNAAGGRMVGSLGAVAGWFTGQP